MTNRRRTLLMLLPLFLLVLFLGQIGTVELTVWTLLLVAWLIAFFSWARPGRLH